MSIAVAATGIFRQPERLSALVASSSNFQTLVGASTMAEAMESVPWMWAGESDVDWPRAVVRVATMVRTKAGTGLWVTDGVCEVSFEFEVPETAGCENDQDECNWFMNQVGAIISDMETNSGAGTPYTGETHLEMREEEMLDGPWKEPASEDDVPDPASGDRRLPRWWIRFAIGFS